MNASDGNAVRKQRLRGHDGGYDALRSAQDFVGSHPRSASDGSPPGLAVLGGADLLPLHMDESEARKRRKKRAHGEGDGGNGGVLPTGALCDDDNQCAAPRIARAARYADSARIHQTLRGHFIALSKYT